MSNTKTTKRALFSGIMAMILCVCMLIGTTFAWFTDSVTVTGNKIQAGTLDISLEMWDGSKWVDAEGKTLNFQTADGRTTNILWEPGCTYVLPKLRVVNNGNLAAKVQIQITGINGDAKLNEVINWYGTSELYSNGTSWYNLSTIIADNYAVMPEGKTWDMNDDKFEFQIKGEMKKTAGNEYQGLSIDGVTLTILATQMAYEKDSFNDQYDLNAEYPDVWDGTIGTVPEAVDNVVTISTAAELAAFANDVNINGKNYSGVTVKLANDINLGNMPWTPIGQTGATEFRGVFDGQGNTIYNLNVDSAAQTGEHYSSGLFGWAEAYVTIQNVNIDGATVTGHHNVAALVGYTYSAKITNCHVTNATIVCTHADDEACGDKSGSIAGYAGDESRFTNCSATDCTVKAGRDAGQLIGAGYTGSISDCSATNVTVMANGTCNGSNVNATIIGRVLGE